jgi:hypothetical protein
MYLITLESSGTGQGCLKEEWFSGATIPDQSLIFPAFLLADDGNHH